MALGMVPFGAKALPFVNRAPRDDRFINILNGAVRSGKTWAMIPKVLACCKYKVAGHRVIIGNTKTSIYNNVLSDLFEFVGVENYSYTAHNGRLWLFGVAWIVIGMSDEGSEKKIRGMTIGVAYVDEATLMPRSSWDMLLTRLSPVGARLYATTNPASPMHYLKRDFLDNEAMKRKGYIWQENFVMQDNLSLDEETIERISSMFTGVFYQRMIQGLWVIAEGAVYGSAWDGVHLYKAADEPIALRNQGGYLSRAVTIDYGTHNPCVFLDVYDDGKDFWVPREYYWDSSHEYAQKTDAQYRGDLQRFIGPANNATVIIDPSAASFKVECQQAGIVTIDANNDVLDGIRLVSTAFANRRVHVCAEHCPNFVREHQSYAWDGHAAKLGEEKPIKSGDHSPDAFRYFVKTVVNPYRLAA